MPVICLVVAADASAFWTAAGEAVGWDWRYKAATPAVCGDAMLVPLIVLVAESLEAQADVMDCPGANQSMHEPQFENEAFASVMVLAPLVMASGTRAGLNWQAGAFELPAATA